MNNVSYLNPQLQFERDVTLGVSPKCLTPYCGGNIYYEDGELKCLLCSTVYDKHGNEIKPEVRKGKVLSGGFRH